MQSKFGEGLSTCPPSCGAWPGAHQTEGNNLASDWWAIEHEPRSFVKEPSGDAVDSFHRWREDMDLAAGAGFTDYRFGVEWSRVEPVEGFFSRAAIDHYRRMVEGARARGLRPFVTLHHFTVPLWFAATGGWLRTDATEKYLRYVEAIEPVLTDSVEHVGTINEPNIVAMLARRKEGEAPGLSRGLPLPDPRVTDALIDVHHTTRAKLKAAHPHLRVGWGISVQDCQPEPGAESVFATYVHPRDEVFAEAARGNHWVGVQTYTRIRVGIADGRPVEIAGDGPKTLTGWEYYPDALGGALRRIAGVVGETPIIVTENGIATDDDHQRIEYTRAALASMQEAIGDGIDVRGYLHWSVVDNYERGDYRPTFGLVAVDRSSFERTPRPSLRWLGAQHPSRHR